MGSGVGYGRGNGVGGGYAPPPPLVVTSKPVSTPTPANSYIIAQTVTNSRLGILNSNNQMPKTISGGVVNGKAVNLPKPNYPSAAKAVRATGAVSVQVVIDEIGDVISARAVSGHPLLHQAAVTAARQAKFQPILLTGKPVKVSGIIVYNFVMQTNSLPQVNVSLGETKLPTEEIKPPEPLTPAAKRQKLIDEKLHLWLADLVARLDKNVSAPTINESKFVRDGKAQIQIWLTEKSPAAIETLKKLGFEIVSENNKKIVGRISLEKLAALAEIEQVNYVLPNLK
jgi:TonB family protein